MPWTSAVADETAGHAQHCRLFLSAAWTLPLQICWITLLALLILADLLGHLPPPQDADVRLLTADYAESRGDPVAVA